MHLEGFAYQRPFFIAFFFALAVRVPVELTPVPDEFLVWIGIYLPSSPEMDVLYQPSAL